MTVCNRNVQLIVFAIALWVSFVGTVRCTESPEGNALSDVNDVHQAIEAFHTWFDRRYGGSCPVRIGVVGDGMRLGVFARRRIPAESLYLSIPMDLIISDDTIFSTPSIGSAIRDVLRSALPQMFSPQQLALNLFLIHQLFIAQRRSFFYPYLQLLPREHNIPELFNDSELQLLAGTLIPEKAHNQRLKHRNEYQALKPLLLKHPNVFPLQTFTWEHHVWAQGILNTRMIWWDGAPHLVPMLDMINCGEGAANPRRVHSTRRGSSNHADTYAPWTFEKGDQVLENYGQPNPTYFLYHGFVMSPNVHDCAQVSVEGLNVSRATAAHKQALRRSNLMRSEYCVTGDASSLQDLIAVARILELSSKEAEAVRAPPRGRMTRRSEGRALTRIKRLLRNAAHSMKTDDELAAALDRSDRSWRLRMIAAFVTSQRALLLTAVDTLERLIAPLRRTKSPRKSPVEERTPRTDPVDEPHSNEL